MKSAMISNTPLIDLYRLMRRIRTFEEHVGELYVRGLSAGSMLHLSIGEEAAAAGVCAAMKPQDNFTTHHRGHGVFLARGADPKRMMAEIGGREVGYCRGKGGSMHIADRALGHLGANAIVGGGIPHVVGAGLAAKRLKNDSIAVAFFGDGAMQQGILYESMNMAALWDLPVLFVCINNQYGMGTRIDHATRSIDFDLRAKALGLAADMADGQRRRRGHEQGAGAGRRRAPGQARLSFRLLLPLLRARAHGQEPVSQRRGGRGGTQAGSGRVGALGSGSARTRDRRRELDEMDAAIGREMSATIEFTANSPQPPLSSMFRDVFAPGEPEPEPVRTRLRRVLADA